MADETLPQDTAIATNDAEKPIRVLISYCHYDGDENYRDRVRELAQWLHNGGIDCELDQYHETTPPTQGWAKWMLDQIDAADYVLVVCTPTYYKRFRGHEEPNVGKGGAWEGGTILQEIYDASGRNDKFIPIGWMSHKDVSASIPEPMRPTNYYDMSKQETYDNLYRRVTVQPAIVKPQLGQRRVMPPVPLA